jgi:hypothetical protein
LMPLEKHSIKVNGLKCLLIKEEELSSSSLI